MATLLRFFLLSAPAASASALNREAAPTPGVVMRSLEEYLGIPTGGFFRDSGAAAAAPGEGAQGGGEITLIGTLAGSPDFARALIQETGQSDPQSFALGKTVAGFKLVGIASDYITVESGGNRYRIKVGEKSGQAQVQTPAAQTAPAGGENVQRVVVQRSKLQELIRNPAAIAEVKGAAFTRGDQILGWRLILVPPNNFMYQLGARSGDIIRRFNGQKVENPEKLLQVMQTLQTANQVSVEVERAGQIISFDITIQ